MNLKMTGLLLAAVLAVVGCSKDENTDDYNDRKLRETQAELQGIAGRYSGILTSTQSKARLGALEVTLSVSSAPATGGSAGSGTGRPTGTPIILSTVRFQAGSSMVISGQNSFYDVSSGHFGTQIDITPDATSSNVFHVVIDSVISGNQMAGTLNARGYETDGGSIQLTKDGKQIAQLVKENKFDASPLFTQGVYKGTTTFHDGTTKPVSLVILKPQTSAEADFLNLLVPVKQVTATLNYGNGARIPFSGAQLDLRSQLLTGQTTLSLSGSSSGSGSGGSSGGGSSGSSSGSSGTMGGTQMAIVCQMTGSQDGFDCQHSTGTSEGVAANTHVQLKPAGTPDEPDQTAPRDSISRSYDGTASFTDPYPPHQPKVSQVKLSVLYPARTRYEEVVELFLPDTEKVVSVVFSVGAAPSPFPSAKWDTENATLDQTVNYTNPNYTASIQCRNFHFTEKPYEFTCNYYSSFTGVTTEAHFKSK